MAPGKARCFVDKMRKLDKMLDLALFVKELCRTAEAEGHVPGSPAAFQFIGQLACAVAREACIHAKEILRAEDSKDDHDGAGDKVPGVPRDPSQN